MTARHPDAAAVPGHPAAGRAVAVDPRPAAGIVGPGPSVRETAGVRQGGRSADRGHAEAPSRRERAATPVSAENNGSVHGRWDPRCGCHTAVPRTSTASAPPRHTDPHRGHGFRLCGRAAWRRVRDPHFRAQPHRETGAGGADATKRAAQTSSVADRHTAGKNVRGRTARTERCSPHLLPDECSRHDGTPIDRGSQPPSENVTNGSSRSTAYVAAYPGVLPARRHVPGHSEVPRHTGERGGRAQRAGRRPT